MDAKQYILNNQEITEDIKEEIKKYLEKMTIKTQRPKPM